MPFYLCWFVIIHTLQRFIFMADFFLAFAHYCYNDYYLNLTVLMEMCAVLSTGIYRLYTVSRCLNDSSEI